MDLKQWHFAIDNCKIDKIKKMIKNKFDVTTDNDYAFRRAAYLRDLELMELLLENGANINVNKSYALRTCIYNGHLDCVKFLIDHGSKIHKDCLKIMTKNNYINKEIIELLIENDVDLDTGNNGLVNYFLDFFNRDYPFVKFLIDKGIVIYPDDMNKDDLVELIYVKEYDILELLLKNGLNATQLISSAICAGDEYMLELLFEYNVNVNEINMDDLMEYYEGYYFENYWQDEPNSRIVNAVKFMIKKQLPVEYLDNMLKISNKYLDYKMVKLLKKNGAKF